MAADCKPPYLCAMSWFPRPSSPLAALKDFKNYVIGQPSREQIIGAALALLVTIIIVIEFIVDAQMGTAPPPRVVYAESWPVNRSDAEIIADQKADQAKLEAALKERQRQFQKLENQFGM